MAVVDGEQTRHKKVSLGILRYCAYVHWSFVRLTFGGPGFKLSSLVLSLDNLVGHGVNVDLHFDRNEIAFGNHIFLLRHCGGRRRRQEADRHTHGQSRSSQSILVSNQGSQAPTEIVGNGCSRVGSSKEVGSVGIRNWNWTSSVTGFADGNFEDSIVVFIDDRSIVVSTQDNLVANSRVESTEDDASARKA